MLLGVIGDDFTGSSDVANVLTRGGMSTVQYVGTPLVPASAEVEAGVIALKTRSIDVKAAVAQSLRALDWLLAQGCQQFLFKYCSTFDSTPEGNIGPVAEALAARLDAKGVIACPAFPDTGRSVFQGHLFVGDKLLNQSGMENHPLNPMTDADIRRWLALQARDPVGHVPASWVWKGEEAVNARIQSEVDRGCTLVIADAIRNEDLVTLGRAAAGAKLITGGSGIAMGLPENFRRRDLIGATHRDWEPQVTGRAAVLSGSCSSATRRQINLHAKTAPARYIDADDVVAGTVSVEDLVDWALTVEGTPLLYTSSDPETVAKAQLQHGREVVSSRIEALFAEIGVRLVRGGTTRLVVAGGETSGAVVEGLGVSQLIIGPEIDPGVPALRAGPHITLALKSGNFGSDDFFHKADAVMAGREP